MLKFLGIGAQKCGTTWLHRTLSRHPDVGFPGGKEVHFWDTHLGTRGLAWYAGLFKHERKLEGDITPAYGFLPVEIIQQIRRWAPPDLRLIYMIRDPRERAWSSARKALERAEMTHDEASDQWFIDHFRSAGSMQRGNYEGCIRNWRTVFPEDSLLVVRYEELCHDPVTLANRCLEHLGIQQHLFTEQDLPSLQERQYAGDGVPLRPSLRLVLDDLYQPQISALAHYLNMDLSDWQK